MIAALRMPAFTHRHLARLQLGCLILALALLSRPLAGIEIPQPPILIPLAADLVPLSTGLQAPPTAFLHAFTLPAKQVLGLARDPAFAPKAASDAPFEIGQLGYPGRGAIDNPRGRSPPSF
jgi:hypothetical protein